MFRIVTLLAATFVVVLGAPRVLQRPRYPVVGEDRIVGGSEVTIEEVPYQLSFEEFGVHICGASLIGAQWALTAAHCADGSRPEDISVRSGSATRGSGGVVHAAIQIIVNENFDAFTIDYDVALIRVNQSNPFIYSDTTAAVVLSNVAPAAGTPAFVSGWGTTSSGGGTLPTSLRWVEVPIYDQAACNVAYEEFGGVTDRMICAGREEGGVDSCQGDSGGPLVAGGQLVGIVSWGRGCALPGYPGVYTDVAALYIWIHNNSAH